MGKKIFIIAMAAALVVAACSEEEIQSVPEGTEITVSFTAAVPSSISTRAFSDGTTATKLSYAVYEADNSTPVIDKDDAVDFNSNLTATVDIQLVSGIAYDIVFWADCGGTSPYDFDADNQNVSVSYSACNDDTYDAFYGKISSYTAAGSATESIALSRPFAQINFGTNDLDADAISNYVSGLYPTLTVKGVYSTLNLLSGEVSGAVDDAVTLTAESIPSTEETFPLSGYDYLAMCYVLVGAEQSLVDCSLTMASGEKTLDAVSVTNAPVKANYRTNIYGALLTETGSFSVTIDPAFGGDYPTIVVTTADELSAALSAGEDAVLANDITVSNLSLSSDNDYSIDLNSNALTFSDDNSTGIPSGSSLTITNGTIYTAATYTTAQFAIQSNASMTVEDVTIISEGAVFYPRGDAASVTVKNSTVTAQTYAVATNAATVDNYGVVITLENSTFSSYTPVMTNIPCTLVMTDCVLKGDTQGLLIRGGTATVTGCQITLDVSDYKDADSAQSMANYFSYRNWGSGNTCEVSALTMGNKHDTSYQYATDVTLIDTDLIVDSGEYTYEQYFATASAYANSGEGIGVTFTYDGDCTFTGGRGLVYASTNITVNGTAVTAAYTDSSVLTE